MVAFAVPSLAQNAIGGDGGVDVLGQGIFETEGSAFHFPIDQDANIDSVTVGNDNAIATGFEDKFPFGFKNGPATAQNNLEIKKNQQSGDCQCCQAINNTCPCENCCGPTLNIENIKLGNRMANAFGFASATNNIKIVTNQMGGSAVGTETTV